MSSRRSVGAKRQDRLRVVAYRIVDQRSGSWCEAWTGSRISIMGNTPGRCPYPAFQHHHRRPRRSGGSTDPTTETAANLVHLCVDHHDDFERNRNFAYALGLLVPAGHDPATTPIRLWIGWVLLTADGRYEPTKETA